MYSIGDKVKIIDAGCGAYGANGLIGIVEAIDHKGNKNSENGLSGKGVIIRMNNGRTWKVSLDFLFEMIEKKKGEKNMFTKSDIKVGQIIELRNGNKKIVMPRCGTSTLVFTDASGNYVFSSDFNSDLTYAGRGKSLDIVKVYGLAEYNHKIMSFDCSRDVRSLLFERPAEIKELTMDQIAALAGIPVSQLKIKK